jgi:N utilization substance protein B
MPSRHRSRQRALQILFLWDARRGDEMSRLPAETAISAYYDSLYSEETSTPPGRDDFVEQLVKGVTARIDTIDGIIARHAEHWKISRMPAVDRNVLRLAVFEMLSSATPRAVVIDEALELARKFSGEEAVHFVNGVLDAVRRELESEPGRAAGSTP